MLTPPHGGTLVSLVLYKSTAAICVAESLRGPFHTSLLQQSEPAQLLVLVTLTGVGWGWGGIEHSGTIMEETEVAWMYRKCVHPPDICTSPDNWR